ncbi:AAA family ATPase [Halovenus salina]|uniref:AAA family ATPase n=2 Tax=Halovenus salina TaxID=1510225 RepID=A0ABD5VWH0_9EURY|nr:AAA family ATPase [Halovenus salina]
MGEYDHVVVAVCGLPGVGKSTVSSYLTDRLDGVRLRTDAIRKELVDEPVYTDAEGERVYDELFSRTEHHVQNDEPVVLDATFADERHRKRANRLAEDLGAEFRLIRVVCDADVVENRIESREDISDADAAIYRQFKDEFDSLDLDYDRIDNSESLSRTRAQVDALFETVLP